MRQRWNNNQSGLVIFKTGTKLIHSSVGLVTSQLADGPTRRRIKSSRDVGELVVNPIQLIRS